MIGHLWRRWSKDYVETLWKVSKWHTPSRKLRVGDVVCLRDEPLPPTKWPLAKAIDIHSGKDGRVRVVTLKTVKGIYKQPVIKMVPLVPTED